MKLFEVFLGEGVNADSVLSAEVLEETGAQVMTPEQAELVGLEGVPADPEGRRRILIACRPQDERLITSRLERHEGVNGFKLHLLG